MAAAEWCIIDTFWENSNIKTITSSGYVTREEAEEIISVLRQGFFDNPYVTIGESM
jgi:hypothetical protein